MYALLALLPIFAALVLMSKFKVSPPVSLVISILAAGALGAWVWKMNIGLIGAVSLLGVLKSLDIILIIYGAILLLNILRRSGALNAINGSLAAISQDKRIQLIVIAWMFSGFIEGAAGFGAAAALAAPLLAGLGFPAAAAVAVSMICNTMPVPFGAVGTPALTMSSTLSGNLEKNGVAVADFMAQAVTECAGIFASSGTFIPLIAVVFLILTTVTKDGTAQRRRMKDIMEITPLCILSGLLFAVPWYLTARFLGPELPSMLGVAVGLPLLLLAIKFKFLVPRHVWDFPGNTEQKSAVPQSDIPVWKAWLPYVIIAVTLVLTRLDALPLKKFLNTFGKISINDFCGLSGVSFSWAVFNNPGIIPFVFVAVGSAMVFGLKRDETAELCLKAVRQIAPSSIAIAASVAMVQIMVYSGGHGTLPGMLTCVANSMADMMGKAYPAAAPVIGALGAFFAGSCTVSGILFVSIQYDTAVLLNLPATAIVALQLAGGGIGSMIRISGVVAACATVNAAGQEAKLILQCLIPALILTLLSLLAAWVLYL